MNHLVLKTEAQLKLEKSLGELASKEGFLDSALLDLRQIKPNQYLREWVKKGYHGDMTWLEKTLDIRENPKEMWPEYPSVALLLFPYYTPEGAVKSGQNRISVYAQGRDYHKVMGKKLKRILLDLQNEFQGLSGRTFVDTGPLSEKYLASHTHLGWIGKNTNLLSPRYGSFFFIGSILLNLFWDRAISLQTSHCGTCNRCLDVCPTNALLEPGIIDGRLCLSYQTIEKEFPARDDLLSQGNWIYGCDDCQTVCPFNRFKVESQERDFQPRHPESLEELAKLSEEEYLSKFAGTPVRRSGYTKFMQAIRAQLNKSQA